jgi:hypothetical protein
MEAGPAPEPYKTEQLESICAVAFQLVQAAFQFLQGTGDCRGSAAEQHDSAIAERDADVFAHFLRKRILKSGDGVDCSAKHAKGQDGAAETRIGNELSFGSLIA